MSDFILVKSGRPDNKVVLWEKDDRHPGGEAWVDGTMKNPVEVYPTDTVRGRLADGQLVEVKPEKKAPAAKESAKEVAK